MWHWHMSRHTDPYNRINRKSRKILGVSYQKDILNLWGKWWLFKKWCWGHLGNTWRTLGRSLFLYLTPNKSQTEHTCKIMDRKSTRETWECFYNVWVTVAFLITVLKNPDTILLNDIFCLILDFHMTKRWHPESKDI